MRISLYYIHIFYSNVTNNRLFLRFTVFYMNLCLFSSVGLVKCTKHKHKCIVAISECCWKFSSKISIFIKLLCVGSVIYL